MANYIGGPGPKKIKLRPEDYNIPGLQRMLQMGPQGAKTSASGSKSATAIANTTALGTNSTPTTTKPNFNNLVPFISNVSNAFRKAPNPAYPHLIAPVSFAKPTNAVELRDIDRATLGANQGADNGLDSNTAAAVKSANLATNLNAKGASYERARNTGIALDNQAASMNANINMANMQKLDQYEDSKVNAQIAGQTQSSENVSNAADKFVQIQARKDAMDLDTKRFDILSKAYAGSGVTDRLVRQILKKGPNDTVSSDEYQKVLNGSTFALGGKMGNGGRIGGSIMHTPKLTRTRQLKKLY